MNFKGCERSGRRLVFGTISAFPWKNWRNPHLTRSRYSEPGGGSEPGVSRIQSRSASESAAMFWARLPVTSWLFCHMTSWTPCWETLSIYLNHSGRQTKFHTHRKQHVNTVMLHVTMFTFTYTSPGARPLWTEFNFICNFYLLLSFLSFYLCQHFRKNSLPNFLLCLPETSK
jgi:hypothetical protein